MKSIELIDQKIESDKSKDWRRPHLGGSGIGEECLRKIWYTFRWFSMPDFGGRILRLFRRGEAEEAVFVADLERIGIKVSVGPKKGSQWAFKRLGGHFGGSIDGAGKGFAEIEDDWALIEFKTHNEKSFNDLVKRGLKASKPIHFDQVQIYGFVLGFTKAMYFAVCKNDDRRYSEVVSIEESIGEDILRKADHIIRAKEPPAKIAKSGSFFICKWCSHIETCHYNAKPEFNCRTCIHSTPSQIDTESTSEENDGGVWICENNDKRLTLDEQKKGCMSYEGY